MAGADTALGGQGDTALPHLCHHWVGWRLGSRWACLGAWEGSSFPPSFQAGAQLHLVSPGAKAGPPLLQVVAIHPVSQAPVDVERVGSSPLGRVDLLTGWGVGRLSVHSTGL